jgi:L-lactate dehydrogenase complex protein LldG
VERERFIGNIAARLGRRAGADAPPVPLRGAESAGDTESADREALVRQFCERLADVSGTAVVVADRAEAQAAVERLVADRGHRALDCPAALRWPAVVRLCAGDPRTADFGLSEARWAIAETGTVVLWHEADTPRASSLVPPAAGVIVPASGIVPRLGSVTAHLAETERRDLPACVTFMSGPSRSMDIGYVSCMGVHGPGEVVVWVIADE